MSGGLFLRLALLVYFLGVAGFTVHVLRQHRKAGQVAHWMMVAGFCLQGLSLVLRALQMGQLPVVNLAEALEFFGWALAGAYLVLYWRFKLPVLGTFASPLTVILVFLGVILEQGHGGIGAVYRSVWVTLHLGTVFGGYAFFGLAFVAGIMYLLQENQIKTKRPGALYRRLPSLNTLDNLNHLCLTLGFPLMTIGIITGMVYAQIAFGAYWRWDPKEVWTLILWLFYAMLLHQRLTVGWRGRRAAIMAIIGFSVLCFSFIGVSLVLPGYHSFESLRQLRVQ